MKIGVLGCKGTTLDLLEAFAEGIAGYPVSQVITLPAAIAERNRVAFFRGDGIEDHCARHGIPVREAASYTLTADDDLAFFADAGLDLLVVIGWERLLPPAILGTLGLFACGMHGSAFGLPRGRGRSPLNWSLITGQPKFVTYLFRYDPGVDSGDVIGFKVFDINDHDDAGTLHQKNRIAMVQLLRTYLPLIARGTAVLWPQPPEEPSFYPKRTPEDGAVDWHAPTNGIHRLIRALAPPYPPAFTRLGETRIGLLAAQPFDTALFPSSVDPGTVVDVSRSQGRFAVKTGDGSLLVTAFDGIAIADLHIGDRFDSVDASEQRRAITARYGDGIPNGQREIR